MNKTTNRILGLAAGALLAANGAWAQGQGWVDGLDYATPYTFTTIAGSFESATGGADGTNTVATFGWPYGLVADTNDTLYVVDAIENEIRKVAPEGTNWVVTTIAGTAGNTGNNDGMNQDIAFNEPTAIAMDTAGNLYVTDANNNSLRRLVRSGTNWVSSTIATGLYFPVGVAVDAATNVYVADTYNNVIRRVAWTGSTWTMSIIAGSLTASGTNDGTNQFAQFNLPSGLAIDRSGNLFVGDSDEGRSTIREIKPMGTNWVVTTIAGNPDPNSNQGSAVDGTNGVATFSSPIFGGPMGLAVDANDNLYVTDNGYGLVRKVSPVGADWVTTTLAGQVNVPPTGDDDGTGTNAVFGAPCGIVEDAAGRLFVSDAGTGQIREGTLAAAPVMPRLAITASAHSVTISWPGTGYTLQTNASLTTRNWAAFGQAATTTNGTNTVTVLSPAGTLFFRLSQ